MAHADPRLAPWATLRRPLRGLNYSTNLGYRIRLLRSGQAFVAPSLSSTHADLQFGGTVNVFSKRSTSAVMRTAADEEDRK